MQAAIDAFLGPYAPHIVTWTMVVVGLVFFVYALRSLHCGYIYPDIKYSFTEGNRIYRNDDPINYWFALIVYGSLGSLVLGGGLYGLYVLHSR